jgi:hypothetical protein
MRVLCFELKIVFLRVFSWLEADGGGGQNASEDNAEDQEDYADSFPSHRPLPHALTYEDESSEIRDDDPTDCLSDRQTALMDGGQFYIPECTPDGRYKKVNNVAMDRPIRLDQTNIANV